MCPISECVCCPVNKNCCNYPMIPSWLLKNGLLCFLPLQQIILYIKYCTHVTTGTTRHESDSCHHMFPVIAFVWLALVYLFWCFFCLFFLNCFCMKLHSCLDFWYCIMLCQLSVGLRWQLRCQKCSASEFTCSVFTCTAMIWGLLRIQNKLISPAITIS